jgi:site-specific DNA-adenine methylase
VTHITPHTPPVAPPLSRAPLVRPLKWVGSHARLAPRILDAAAEVMTAAPTAIVDPTLGGGGWLVEALQRWPDAPAFIGDTCEPLVDLWRAIAEDGEALERRMEGHGDAWARADDVAATVLTDILANGGGPMEADSTAALVRRDTRRTWHREERSWWNAERHRDQQYGLVADFHHSARFAALIRGAYNGLCRFNKSGGLNSPCGAHIDDPHGKPLYSAGSFQALGADLQRRGCTVALGSFRDTLVTWAPSLKGALVYIDPPFPGTFSQYSAGGGTPTIAELAEACAWASACGATVVASHPVAGAEEWRDRLPAARVLTDLTRRGSMEPNTRATQGKRKDATELLVVLSAARV